MTVLTDVYGKPGRFWGNHSRFVPPPAGPRALTTWFGARWSERLCGAVGALRLAAAGKAAGVVTGGGPAGMVLGLIRALLPGRRKPHVMVDCNWYECSGRLRRWVRKAQLHCVGMSVQRFVVWARHEIADYADEFGLRRDQFTYVPFHGTLDHYDYEIKDEGYLFAGGNYDRDYATLVQAVRGLAVPVWIATTRPLGRAELPDNVRVEGTTPAGFRQAMAAARIVVVPMAPGLLHSGGQQTCLNAMLMGKPTIAVGRKWADDFIQHGVNGLVVDYSDAAGLTTAIRWALNHPAEARAMGQRARLQAQQFSTRRCMQTIYGLVAAGERKP